MTRTIVDEAKELRAQIDGLLSRVEALSSALSAVLPKCCFVLDRESWQQCRDIAVYGDNLGVHFCVLHSQRKHALRPLAAQAFTALYGITPEEAKAKVKS